MKRQAYCIALFGALALALGWVVDNPFAVLFLATLAWALLLWWQQWRLFYWIDKKENRPLPAYLGEALSAVAKRTQKHWEKKRKYKKHRQDELSDYEELAKVMPEAVIITDRQGQLIHFNQVAQHIFQLSAKLDMGKNLVQLIRYTGFADFLHSTQDDERLSILLRHEERFIELRKTRLPKKRWLIIGYDVTRMVRLEMKRKAFIDNASHELKTPLTVISGFLELLHAGDVPETWRLALDEMQTQAERMRLLVERILQLAQLEDSEHPLNESNIYLPDFLNTICNTIQNEYPNSIGIELRAVAPYTLRADALILHSVIANLLSNALLHAQSRTPIQLSVKAAHAGLVIQISDQGIGVDDAHISRLTERFYRIETAQVNKGSGLGLAIVKHGIEAHGGTLHIHSRKNSGSTFTLTLPQTRILKCAHRTK